MMRKTALSFAAVLVALALLGCAQKHTAPQAGTESGSVPGSPGDPSAAQGSTRDMLLKAGFAVPKSDIAASDFTLQAPDGKRVSLASYRRSLVFLSFWATWCGPCKQELPSLQALYEKLKGKGFTIVAVDVMENGSTVSDFVKANRMTFPVLLDTDGKVGADYEARSLPTNYIVDRSGMILARIVGYDGTSWDSPERIALIEKLLSL
jgi:thiol-disulfide isomerase/thioredoxin